jgi:peroxiredoxin
MLRWIPLVLVGGWLLGTTALHAGKQVPLSDGEKELLKGMRVEVPSTYIEAHDFPMRLLDGRELQLNQLQGRFVLLNFWATWCAPCLKEMPDMDALQDTVGTEQLTVLAVSMGETEERVRKFLKMHGFGFPIVADTEMSIVQIYGVKNIPITYLIDPQGVILGRALGPREWNRKAFQDFIQQRVQGS